MFSHRTINYAAPPPGMFWRWSADHDAVEWYDGATLAMWPELHAVLHFLGENNGLPPLGAVLLLLAACRDEWLGLCIPFHQKVMEILGVDGGDAIPLEIKDTLVRDLKVVNDLPKDLRGSLAAKCLLVSTLFEGGPHSLLKEESALILRQLSVHGPVGFRGELPKMDAKARFLRDLRALRLGLARHDGASLESLLRTGLENLTVLKAPIPEPPSGNDDSRPLLDRLMTLGGEGGAAAAVAKRAIAMMNLPGVVGRPRDLPVGGISDITNRGTVDRLLPGELAWDDLVLAARLVHNEALYFRREIPPLNVAVNHTVLLDRGLRLWGTGRIFSLGVALGLRHHPALNHSGESFECLAASQDGFTAIDLATPGGVFSALEALIPAAGPDAFLTTWWDAARAADDTTVPEISFITAKEHLEAAATRSLLGNMAAWIHGKSGRFRVISLGRAGDVAVQEWSPGGIRDLFRGEIDLDEISPTPKVAPARELAPPPLRKKADPLHEILPIYALDRLPFLFPNIPQGLAMLPEGATKFIGVSHDKRLMEWPKKGWGGQDLGVDLPGRRHWMAYDDQRHSIVIASGSVPGDSVRVFRYRENKLDEIEFVGSLHSFPNYATVSGGAVLLAYGDSVEALSLETGNRVAELSVKTWAKSPILEYDGERIHLHGADDEQGALETDWLPRDKTWPQMLFPTQIAFSKGRLQLACSTVIHEFHPMELCWKLVKSSNATFVEFDNLLCSAASISDEALLLTAWAKERGLQYARMPEGVEAWFDPRGLLHLRREGAPPWSILLTTSNAAVWNESWGLCAFEERLRFPTESEPLPFALRVLQGFLKATEKP